MLERDKGVTSTYSKLVRISTIVSRTPLMVSLGFICRFNPKFRIISASRGNGALFPRSANFSLRQNGSTCLLRLRPNPRQTACLRVRLLSACGTYMPITRRKYFEIFFQYLSSYSLLVKIYSIRYNLY